MDNYYDKLHALLTGLEVEHLGYLLVHGEVETYRKLGESIATMIKELKR